MSHSCQGSEMLCGGLRLTWLALIWETEQLTASFQSSLYCQRIQITLAEGKAECRTSGCSTTRPKLEEDYLVISSVMYLTRHNSFFFLLYKPQSWQIVEPVGPRWGVYYDWGAGAWNGPLANTGGTDKNPVKPINRLADNH